MALERVAGLELAGRGLPEPLGGGPVGFHLGHDWNSVTCFSLPTGAAAFTALSFLLRSASGPMTPALAPAIRPGRAAYDSRNRLILQLSPRPVGSGRGEGALLHRLRSVAPSSGAAHPLLSVGEGG